MAHQALKLSALDRAREILRESRCLKASLAAPMCWMTLPKVSMSSPASKSKAATACRTGPKARALLSVPMVTVLPSKTLAMHRLLLDHLHWGNPHLDLVCPVDTRESPQVSGCEIQDRSSLPSEDHHVISVALFAYAQKGAGDRCHLPWLPSPDAFRRLHRHYQFAFVGYNMP